MNHASPHSYPNHEGYRVCAARYVAEGGTVEWRRPGLAGQADAKGFTLEPVEQHVGWGRYRGAKIPWGAPLREDRGKVWAQIDGRWRDVEQFAGIDRDQICSMYWNMFKGDARVPARWVFNDFHRVTAYSFVDENHEYTHDPGVRRGAGSISMTGTPTSSSTPWANGASRGDLGADQGWCDLNYLHGCLHLRAEDFSEMIERGYVAWGNVLVVHPEPERCMATASAPTWSEPPYELHFYPGDEAIFVYGWAGRDRSTSS